MQPSAHVPAPDITFRDGTPVSEAFGDVYFSRAGGIAETEYVFIAGNRLPERFAALNSHPRAPKSVAGEPGGRNTLTIGELGFGTGLNFLVAWQQFVAHAPAGAHLQFISVEKFPLTRAQLTAALALQPALQVLADQLIAHYPLRLPGWHRLHFPRVTLTLGFGDVAELLPQLIDNSCVVSRGEPRSVGGHDPSGAPARLMVDAWFLDGFAPAKNEAMWRDTVFETIGRLSAPDATFATFTAAGSVRRAMAAQGFAVEKIKGYGHKREMLVGKRETCSTAEDHSRAAARSASPHILVLGAGIAGATAARALAERGYPVTVLEKETIAHGASGNAAGVLFPQLTKRWTASAAWHFAGYSFMLHQLKRWSEDEWQPTGAHDDYRRAGNSHAAKREAWEGHSPIQLQGLYTCCGMLRLPRHAEEQAQLQQLNDTLGLDPGIVHWVTREEASAIAGVPLATGAAFFPQGTWLSPAALCTFLLQHEQIALRENTAAISLTREGDSWRATTAQGETFEAAHCILATAGATAQLLPHPALKLGAVAGQTSLFAAADVAAPLRSILCHKGYVVPAGTHYLVGATYEHHDLSCAVTEAGHQKNMAELEAFLPGWLKGGALRGRTAIRATTPDRLPYAGALAPGLWASVGHGSRGLVSAPLAAEIIASAIAGEAPPVAPELLKAVHPHRFQK